MRTANGRRLWSENHPVFAGTLFGAVTGYSGLTNRLVDPTLQALRAIPSIAWVPLFILWFGIFEASKVILIAVGVFFPVYLGVMAAILSVDRKIIEVGRVFRLAPHAMVRRILLPAVLPSYVVSLRAGLGLGWMFVIAAEFMIVAIDPYPRREGAVFTAPESAHVADHPFAALAQLKKRG